MSAKVIHNLEQLAEGIGSYIGMLEGLDQQIYMDNLLSKAVIDASGTFNKHAAAMAMQNPERLRHMWEFGTTGITQGKSKYANPTTQTSRLWVNTMTGTGGTKNINFIFKKATQPVPPHTEAETGVAQSVLDRLKVNTGEVTYKFKNKAFVFESGTDVKIMPKNSKQIFVPTKTEGLPSSSYSRRWGYAWAKSHTYSPGQMSGATGQFTAMFSSWWLGPGSKMLFEQMAVQVEKDLIATDKTIKPSKRMNSAQRAMIQTAVKRGKLKTRKQWTLKVKQAQGERADVLL